VVYSGEDPLQQGTMNRKRAEKATGHETGKSIR